MKFWGVKMGFWPLFGFGLEWYYNGHFLLHKWNVGLELKTATSKVRSILFRSAIYLDRLDNKKWAGLCRLEKEICTEIHPNTTRKQTQTTVLRRKATICSLLQRRFERYRSQERIQTRSQERIQERIMIYTIRLENIFLRWKIIKGEI